MSNQRYPRGTQPGDYYSRNDDMDYSRDYGSGRDYSYSSARDFQAAGETGEAGGDRDPGRDYYGGRPAGNRDRVDRDRSSSGGYHGSYGSDGRRFEDVGRHRDADDDDRSRSGGRGHGRQPEGYDYQERGFVARAGDEVRSWFGDDDAERRREMDSRNDERHYGNRAQGHRDEDYHSWRRGQIDALDRDYDEYRRENQSKFHNEFSSWRTNRQGQRESLSKVKEHAEVVGSDGEHVGTVDKVRGDRILLTKNDADAGGRHHSIPSSWFNSVDDGKVTLTKTAAEAKQAWQDEDRNSATSGWGDNQRGRGHDDDVTQGRTLNRSFSGTY